jgi:hypothetical protein
MNISLSKKNIKIALLLIGVVLFLIIPISLPAQIGATDFRPYWSSSFLLAHGQDFGNPANMDNIERTLTGWKEPYTMSAWFAPTGNLVLLPYILFPFTRATYYWLITNIAIVFLSVTLLWRNTKIHIWIPLGATFGFSMTMLSLIYGQVNTLVVLGLTLFLFFTESKRDFVAGMSLALTTIKPHLVILTLPLLILDIVWRKQWRVLAGFISTLIGCALALYILYPLWPVSFWQVVTSGLGSFREAPTIPGLLVHAGDRTYGKWLWGAGLFLATIIWWKRKKELKQRTLIDASIIAGMILSPIGWSYDQIVLLIPLSHVLEWMIGSSLVRKDTIAITLILIIINLVSFYERTLSLSEVWFFWIPLVIMAVYVFAWKRKQYTVLNVAAAIEHTG